VRALKYQFVVTAANNEHLREVLREYQCDQPSRGAACHSGRLFIERAEGIGPGFKCHTTLHRQGAYRSSQ